MTPPLPVPRRLLSEPTRLIVGNYRRWIGRDLLEPSSSAAEDALFNAPFVVLASAGPPGTDQLFAYANRAALELFEASWHELVGQPSSTSAEPIHRAERSRILDQVTCRGFIEHYSGIRVSCTGRRFRILRATVFNLLDDSGSYVGQAATFPHWEPL